MPDGPGGFTRDFPCPALLRVTPEGADAARKGLSPAAARLSRRFRSRPHPPKKGALQPPGRRNAPGLGSSPVARRYWGNHSYFLFLRVLRCFSSPLWPPHKGGCHPFRVTGCPIREPADRWPHAPPRGLSQLAAPFIASGSLGIRRAPLSTSRGPEKNGPRIFLSSCLSHHVIERLFLWRITDSNR